MRILRKTPWPIQAINNRADFIDFYFIQDHGDEIFLMGFDVSVPKKDFLPIKKHVLGNGTELMFPNITYRRHLDWSKDKYQEHVERLEQKENPSITA